MSIEIVRELIPGWPEWVDQTEFRVKDGRDPLGLETVTTDRIIPDLVPGILALSQRARYFSFHLFLLDEYARRRLDPTWQTQSAFFRMREFEFGAAVLTCNRCGATAAPVGSQSLRGIVRRATDHIDRGYSVDSDYGGYGLYYRTPLRDLGLVVVNGSDVGGEPLPVDVLAGQRARDIAEAFRVAIADTDYFQDHFMGNDFIPVDVLRSYGEVACLCRLTDYPRESELVRSALLADAPGLDGKEVRRRRESFAVRLKLAQTTPLVLTNEAEQRRATWAAFDSLKGAERDAWSESIQRWAALYGKEYYQEGLRVLWREVNRVGRERSPVDGLRPQEYLAMLDDETSGGEFEVAGQLVRVDGAEPSQEFYERITEATARMSLEELRRWAVETEGTCLSALVLLFALLSRLPGPGELPADAGWYDVAREGGNNQPGLASFAAQLRQHLAAGATNGETLGWLVRRFILLAHERIATTKLPDFTFRFRIEGARLRFFTRPGVDFGLADSRHAALVNLARDLGFWDVHGGTPSVTPAGARLVEETFG